MPFGLLIFPILFFCCVLWSTGGIHFLDPINFNSGWRAGEVERTRAPLISRLRKTVSAASGCAPHFEFKGASGPSIFLVSVVGGSGRELKMVKAEI